MDVASLVVDYGAEGLVGEDSSMGPTFVIVGIVAGLLAVLMTVTGIVCLVIYKYVIMCYGICQL